MFICDIECKFWTVSILLKQIFWKTKDFFKKLEYRFVVENTKIENASFPYKQTAISKASVKTNRMVSTKWTYHQEQRFASNYFIFFWKCCFSLRTSYEELIWCTNDPNAHILTFRKRWIFISRCFFPVSILIYCYLESKMFCKKVVTSSRSPRPINR